MSEPIDGDAWKQTGQAIFELLGVDDEFAGSHLTGRVRGYFPPTDDSHAWKQAVRSIYDEVLVGNESIFTGSHLARRLLTLIESGHPDYFCPRKTEKRWSVFWSAEDHEWVGTCNYYPSLSFLASAPEAALTGIMQLCADVASK